MSVKGKNLRHKAMSLSALGAGALIFGGGSADAGTLTCASGMEVGWHSSAGGANSAKSACSVSFGKIGTKSKIGFTFKAIQVPAPKSATASATFKRSILVDGRDMSFEGTGGTLKVLNKNATWSAAPHKGTQEKIGGRIWYSRSFKNDHDFGDAAFTDKYANFRFQTGPTSYDYGWIELTYTVAPSSPPLPYGQYSYGPELEIEAWAYDPTGAQLKAGVLPTSTPEPGTFDSTGLAALALGAAGLRRWRKTRPAA